MKLFLTYFSLEWKKSIKILGKSMVSILVMGFLVVATVTVVSRIFLQSQFFSRVEVAVAIPREERLIQQAMRFVERIDSVNSICRFQYDDLENALEKLHQGQVDAVIQIPENFYGDIYTGKNTPATLYLAGKERIESKVFAELLAESVSMLQTAQAGVYATLDIAGEYEVKMDRGEIGEFISLLYIKEILGRGQFFHKIVASPTGWINARQYYFLTAFLLLLLMSSIYYGFLYTKQTKALEQKLYLYGMGSMQLSLVRVLVMTINLWILGLLVYLGGRIVLPGEALALQPVSLGLLLGLLALCVNFGAYFHLLYSVAEKGIQGGVLLLVINLLMVLCSGLLLPTAYLPKWIVEAGKIMPLTYWQEYGLELLFGNVQMSETALLLGTALIMTGLGAFSKWKKR
ncbi:MAG: ABC transporter permease [Lachnospiraceae bacterium]|nr:ABC transporter permease [Lachnospiraceae bacterium]MDY5699771.1 ABC transporter permease [Lachnospiraceae bacterium]